MKRALLLFCATSLAGTLRAADGDLLAETQSPSPTFEVWTSDVASYAAPDVAAIGAFPPVAWRAGETVTATSCRGVAITLVSAAATDGQAAFAPDAGGVWMLENSVLGTARIGVPWTVFDDGGTIISGDASPGFVVDAKQYGPDRKIARREAPPLSWTCDHWARESDAAATLTLTAPSGTETVLSRNGTGTGSFAFTPGGVWTAALAMADGTTLSATLDIADDATMVLFR